MNTIVMTSLVTRFRLCLLTRGYKVTFVLLLNPPEAKNCLAIRSSINFLYYPVGQQCLGLGGVVYSKFFKTWIQIAKFPKKSQEGIRRFELVSCWSSSMYVYSTIETSSIGVIGSCTFWSLNVWGTDCVKTTNSHHNHSNLVVLLPLGTSQCMQL